MIMAKGWISKGFTIQVLESPDVGIIGVGEGSTPALKTFFDNMDIAKLSGCRSATPLINAA